MESEIKKLRGTGVLWQGRNSEVEEIQHLLFPFGAMVGQSGFILAIMFEGSDKPVQVEMGDEVVVNEFDQFAVLPAEENAVKKFIGV